MTERKRLTGFALMDAAFAADAKFLRLAQTAPSPTEFAAAVGVFWLLLASCRRAKSPLVNWEDFEEYGDQIQLLRKVSLLNGTGFRDEPFNKYAPVYQSPFDARRGTQGDTEIHNGTQPHTDIGSVEVGSSKSPSLNAEGGVGETELPAEWFKADMDAYVFMCRLLGYAPNSEKFRTDVTEMEDKFGVERTVQSAQDAYRRSVEEGHRLSPFDLLKDTRTLLLTGKHRIEKELTAQEKAATLIRHKHDQAAALADIERQHAASLEDALAKNKEKM